MNTNRNLFEIATRNRFRFAYKGSLTVEDLWDLNLTELDTIYKNLNRAIKRDSEESLINENQVDQKTLDAIELVKYIFATKKAEMEQKKLEAENAEKKRKILDILAAKQDESLHNATEEELKKMLSEL